MRLGGNRSYFKIFKWLAASVLILMPFQNCGQDYQANGTSTFTSSNFENSDCLSDVVDCGPSPDFLQISIDLIGPVSAKNTPILNIVGRCNSGNYPNHAIYWELRNATGQPARQGTVNNGCVDGQYSILLDTSPIVANQAWSMYVKMLGVDSDGGRFYNVQANGEADVEVVK